MFTRAPSSYVEFYDGFDWRSAPLSDVRAPLGAGAAYITAVLLLSAVTKRTGGVETRRLQAVHNMVLCVGSLAMALGTLTEVVRRSAHEGSSRWLFQGL